MPQVQHKQPTQPHPVEAALKYHHGELLSQASNFPTTVLADNAIEFQVLLSNQIQPLVKCTPWLIEQEN